MADPTPSPRPGMFRPTRRALVTAGGAALVVGVGGAFAYKHRPTSFRVRQALVQEFGRRVVRGKEADRFIADISHLLDNPKYGRRVKGAFYELPIHEPRIAYFPGRRIRDTAVTLFIQRTNAFRVYARKDRSLVYAGLDPYAAGCSNFISAAYRFT